MRDISGITECVIGTLSVKGGEKVYHWGVYEKELVRLPVGGDLEQLWSELRVFRFFRDLGINALGSNALPAVSEAVAVAVHLQDVDVVSEAVQQRSGEAFRPEDLGPLVEGKVGAHHCGAPLVALAEDLEEQFRPGSGQGHEAQFVDDQQVEPGQLPL